MFLNWLELRFEPKYKSFDLLNLLKSAYFAFVTFDSCLKANMIDSFTMGKLIPLHLEPLQP